MKVVRVLSVIALASFLILQGLFYLAEITSPVFYAFIGVLGMTAGVLMFISLSHWIDFKKEQ